VTYEYDVHSIEHRQVQKCGKASAQVKHKHRCRHKHTGTAANNTGAVQEQHRLRHRHSNTQYRYSAGALQVLHKYDTYNRGHNALHREHRQMRYCKRDAVQMQQYRKDTAQGA